MSGSFCINISESIFCLNNSISFKFKMFLQNLFLDSSKVVIRILSVETFRSRRTTKSATTLPSRDSQKDRMKKVTILKLRAPLFLGKSPSQILTYSTLACLFDKCNLTGCFGIYYLKI